jgi:thiol-disulfide isomerase/thioredoxin
MNTLRKERIEYIETLIDAHRDLYVSKFLKILVPVETHLPEPPKDEQGRITDSSYVYRWYRAHFFDNLNIYDPDMLRTPFYEEKVFDYLTKLPIHTDTICVEADKILTKAKANDEIFRCILVSLFNYYVKSQVIVHENVWVHLADKWYIPYATFSSDDYKETLKKEVEKKTPNLIGKPAPPMEMLMVLPPEHFKVAALDTAIKNDLHEGRMVQDCRKELKGKYTAIVFWDYSCSHCKKFMEEMQEVYEETKDKGLAVITVQTVNTREAKNKWIDYVNDHHMLSWTNAWSPYSNKYRDLYDISSTPLLFLLDEKGVIILKKLQPEQIKDIISQK